MVKGCVRVKGLRFKSKSVKLWLPIYKKKMQQKKIEKKEKMAMVVEIWE